LFSAAERSFLGVLEQAVGKEYRIFGKVRVANVVSVRSASDRGRWQRAFNRISAKHFDFVLCDKSDFAIIGVIELDDKSHYSKKRRNRDAFLSELCDAVTLPLVQIPARRGYAVADIRSQVLDAVQGTSRIGDRSAAPQSSVMASPSSETPADPLCPKCMSPMVRRTANSGAYAGQEFWGCSTFPRCRGVIRPGALNDAPVDAPPRTPECGV